MDHGSRLAVATGLLYVSLWCIPPFITAQTVQEPSFEVVSIRPSGPGEHRWSYQALPDRMALAGANARTLVADAYDKDLPNVVGGPAWIDADQYDVHATFGEAVAKRLAPLLPNDRDAQVFLMLRSALKERFALTTHHETREVSVYALGLAKGGPKFAPAPPAANDAEAREVGAKYNGHLWTVQREPMSFLALQLSRIPEVGRNVVDRTGLKGDYRFNFDVPSRDNPDASVFTVLREQLGLTLQPARSPVDTLIIDHIERPSEN